ncbi:MAG: hypothetical protein R3C26_26720 [Calditrichia bacterium]
MILLIIAMLVLYYFQPYWWWILVLPLFYGFIFGKKPLNSFLVGLSSAGLVWIGVATYQYFNDAAVIAQKIAEMMNVGSPFLLIGITGLIAIICGGVGALTGNVLRNLFR